jgi:hypothetical protein
VVMSKNTPLPVARETSADCKNGNINAVFGYFFGEKKVTCAHETMSTYSTSLRARNPYQSKITEHSGYCLWRHPISRERRLQAA